MKREIIGKELSVMRKSHRKTQADMQKITGINKSTLSEIENGHFTGSLDILERYLDSLGYELAIEPKSHKLPDWDDLDGLFSED